MPENPDTPWVGDDDDRGMPSKVEPPARAAVFFMELLKSNGIANGRIVDLGCGKEVGAPPDRGRGHGDLPSGHRSNLIKPRISTTRVRDNPRVF